MVEYLISHRGNIDGPKPELENSIGWFNKILTFNFFFHDKDDAVLTSKQKIWAYPGKQPIQDSIAVLPEINDDDVCACIGICSDYIRRYHNSTRRIK